MDKFSRKNIGNNWKKIHQLKTGKKNDTNT